MAQENKAPDCWLSASYDAALLLERANNIRRAIEETRPVATDADCAARLHEISQALEMANNALATLVLPVARAMSAELKNGKYSV